MQANIQEFIQHKKIAIVGASRQGNKFGNAAAKELRERGYQTYLVHPDAETIDGQSCYPDLAAVKHLAEVVWVSIPAERGAEVLQQAAQAGFERVWLQQGAESDELVAAGEALGLELVTGKCILMYAEPVRSVHKFHQVVAKLFGRY